MKRNLLTLLAILMFLPVMVKAGGLMTNTNQSASYIRMPLLDAVIGPESAYYNPAGLGFLSNGFYISISNQTISQKRNIQSTFPGMNQSEFEGLVAAPVFPSIYATYKQGPWAFALGVIPVGGGGSALFEEGLPSFGQQVAVLPVQLTAAGIATTQHSYATRFEGQSLFWGIQANAAYALNDMVSVSAGLRYVTATNSYSGYLKDIMINPNFPILGLNGQTLVSAPVFFGSMAGLFGQLAGVAGSLQPIVAGGYGQMTLAQLQAAGVLSAQDVAAISGGFALINPSVNPATLNVATIQAAYQQATPLFLAQQAGMQSSQAATSDKEVDVVQKGSSFAPIFGVHLRFSERFNVGIKYEHKTPLTVKNETAKDDLGAYPDGLEIPNNMPSLLSIGASYGATSKLTLHTGIHYYFDKQAAYGKVKSGPPASAQVVFYENDEIIDNNFIEAGLGAEYQITRKLMISAGYLRTQTGVNEKYHSDQSHSLSTNTFGGGFRYQLNDMVALNLGGLYSQYVPHTKSFTGYTETYDRSNMVVAIGVDIKL